MFTGIIEEVAKVLALPPKHQAGELVIEAKHVLEDVHLGDSIAVNGVCLTVTSFGSTRFAVDVMPQTLAHTSLGDLHVGSSVNLERAMQMGGRFGGHIVSGHIDGTGTVALLTRDQNAVRMHITCSEEQRKLIVERGSIAVDGVSLTVSNLFDDGFEVSVIPHTRSQTILMDKRVGDRVNLENDVIGKYVAALLQGDQDARQILWGASQPGASRQEITLDYLREHGF
ncbi:MAG: riboflavin synthase [Coriobacteriales bacterium]|nr:riboflavin synthase [Coriobacteriales bacterium]